MKLLHLMALALQHRPDATTWRVYDGSAIGQRPLIARGAGTGEPTVLDASAWRTIRERLEEIS